MATADVHVRCATGHTSKPEAVPADYQQALSTRAHRDQVVARNLTLAALAADPLDLRFARCKAQAKHLRIDVHREFRLVGSR